jgi:hypothetical protein
MCKSNKIQPNSIIDLKSKSTPLSNLGKQQKKQWLRGPSKNQPSGGNELPIRLDSEGMRSSYDDLCETSLTGAIIVY